MSDTVYFKETDRTKKKITYWKAYYNNILIAVSQSKKLVKTYMEKHRLLTEDEYDLVQSVYLNDSEKDRELVEFYTVFLPKADRIYLYSGLYNYDWKECKKVFIQMERDASIESTITRNNPLEIRFTPDQLKKVMSFIKARFKADTNQKKAYCISATIRLGHPIAYSNMEVYLEYLKRDILPYVQDHSNDDYDENKIDEIR